MRSMASASAMIAGVAAKPASVPIVARCRRNGPSSRLVAWSAGVSRASEVPTTARTRRADAPGAVSAGFVDRLWLSRTEPGARRRVSAATSFVVPLRPRGGLRTPRRRRSTASTSSAPWRGRYTTGDRRVIERHGQSASDPAHQHRKTNRQVPGRPGDHRQTQRSAEARRDPGHAQARSRDGARRCQHPRALRTEVGRRLRGWRGGQNRGRGAGRDLFRTEGRPAAGSRPAHVVDREVRPVRDRAEEGAT